VNDRGAAGRDEDLITVEDGYREIAKSGKTVVRTDIGREPTPLDPIRYTPAPTS
jgi:hypothetical protein